ncbi:MAG: glycoside hydrolase family 99-like domain-containing protein, partial [Armatimonadetes bacterium]|nr:glycoside hydrolase family 99-like domain-containing protein [Armatimonadota bacterium]
PEVNDWHIKWALEHGISFFCFDWYWNAGEHRLLRTLETGFLKSRYCRKMKFCIHWCNHGLDWKSRPWNKPFDEDFQTKSLVEMTEYLADTYFRLPNYLTIAGRPVLVIWDAKSLIQANGGPDGFARSDEEMNRALRNRGLRDLYLVAMWNSREIREAGFAATTGYGYYGTDYDSRYEWLSGHSLPYDEMVKHYENQWKGITRDKGLPYLLALGSNWDNRPRARDQAAVITGKTPAKFKQMCRNGVKYLDKRVGLAIIEAWNEWGEGSFVEPDKEWGFAFLDAVREVFGQGTGKHFDCVPTPEKISTFSVLKDDELVRAREMEKQPYPDPPFAARSVNWKIDEALPSTKALRSWEFEGNSGEGWMPYHVEPFVVSHGVLRTKVTTEDPQLIVDNVGASIEDLRCLALRMKVSEGVDSCELFWSTFTEPQPSANKSFLFPLKPDGKWHTYQVMKRPEGKWSGTLKLLRLDMGAAGDVIEVDWVRLYGK